MIARPLAVAPLALLGAAAGAQSTNCITMAAGMVHCDSMGSNGAASSTDCTTMNGMSQCQTMPMAPPASTGVTGGATLGVVGNLIAQSRKRSFQKKVGQMLQAGDCQGAANYALAGGRVDTGLAIRRACQPASAPPAATASVEERLRAAAAKANAAGPMRLDANSTVTKVEAIDTQLLVNVRFVAARSGLSDAERAGLVDQVCASPPMADLFRAGATIRFRYSDAGGRDVGAVMVTRRECGL